MLQPILVYMSKQDGKFEFSPISVNFLTETAKVFFAIFMLLIQVGIYRLIINLFIQCFCSVNATECYLCWVLA